MAKSDRQRRVVIVGAGFFNRLNATTKQVADARH
jgi:hypothetical protein